MNKTCKILTILVTISILLFTLSGCGALLNGDKQLTADEIHTAYTGSYSSSSSSGGPLRFYNMYYLTNSSGSSRIWITFKPFTASYSYMFPFDRIGSNTYSLHNGPNTNYYASSLKLKLTQEVSSALSYGYTYFNTNTLYENLFDAYAIVLEHQTNYDWDKVSNPISREDIIYFNLRECVTNGIINCPIEHVYSSSYAGTSGQPNIPYDSCNEPDETRQYLWVHLREAGNGDGSSSLWVNLGYVGSSCVDINPSH